MFTDARLFSKQHEPARYRTRAPIGPRCPSGRVGFQIRPGGCEPLRTCHFFQWRSGRSSDGAWLKTTGAQQYDRGTEGAARRAEREEREPKRGPPPIFTAGSGEFRRRLHKPAFSVQLGILLPLSSGCSVAANALGLGPRDRRRESCHPDHFQIRCVAQSAEHRPVKPGKWVSLDLARDREPVESANPIHLTNSM